MNTKTPIAIICAAALAVLLACSTPKPAPFSTAPPEPAVPAPEVSIELPLEPPAETFARACHLGTTCLEMDPRPFEPCMLSTKDCLDKATEPLLVGQPDEDGIAPPAIIKTR